MLSLLEDHNDDHDAYILWAKLIGDEDFPGHKGFLSEDESQGDYHDDDHDYESQGDYHDDDHDDESQGDDHDESQGDDHDDYLAMLYEETMDPRGNGNDYYYDD